MSNSSDSEARLMARLNALRQSSAHTREVQPSASSEDALSKRLNALRRASSGYSDQSRTTPDGEGAKDLPNDSLKFDNDNFDDAKLRGDIVDLVEASQGARLSKQDLEEAKSTLKLAGNFLRESKREELEHQDDQSKDHSLSGVNVGFTSPPASAIEEDIDKLLEELNIDSNSTNDASSDGATPGSSGDEGLTAELQLPDAPTTISKSAQEDDGINLPSVPSLAPHTSTPGVTGGSLSAMRQASGSFKDAEVDPWCIICCDDAALRCVGCDGDLYCVNCWMEGHRGQDAGHEERSHRAITFTHETKNPQKALA